MNATSPDPNPARRALEALRDLVAPIAPAWAPEFDREQVATNRARLLAFGPLFLLIHLLHVASFWLPTDVRATTEPRLVRWHDAVAGVHAATFALALPLVAALFVAREGRPARAVAPAFAALYLLHAAAIAGADQLNAPIIAPFIAYNIGIAVILALSPGEAVGVFGLGLAAYVAAITAMQPVPEVRRALMPTGPTMVVVSVAIAWFLHAGRRRDFVQRRTIDAQRDELSRVNDGLERRVQAQVAEIVARAAEVDRLNAQLREQVTARSAELSAALARLAERRGMDPGALRGVVVSDRFELSDLLGVGGMGAVYAGRDRKTGERVAVKVIQAQSAAQLDALHRFLREAATTAAVLHPAVCRMYHVDLSDDGILYQVQELVDGESLQKLIQRGLRCDTATTARLGEVLCDALAAAHAQGVVHRDVKPANVLLTSSSPGLKLVDFGIAKVVSDQDTDGPTLTGMLLGTPAFMGPEHVVGSRVVTEKADLYAVGVTLYLVLTGRYPYADTSARGMVERARQAASDLKADHPSVTDPMVNAVMSCLALEPDQRPTAAAMRDTLRRYADSAKALPLDVLVREGVLPLTASTDTTQEPAPR